MKVQFIGATHEVTGSCTLLEVSGRYYLVDCGMEQGEDIFQNVPLPVPANAIEAVFLTHAHIDHSGMLPKLCKDGFRGQIYATEATCNLCRIMLMDSAHIQESEAQWRTRKAERAGERAVEPVYDTNDAAAALRLLRPCQYNAAVQAAEGIIIRMHVEDINVQSRYGSGVRVMRLGEGDRVVTVARTEHSDEEETAKPEDDGAEEELSAEELAALEAEEAQNAAGEEDAAPEDGE